MSDVSHKVPEQPTKGTPHPHDPRQGHILEKAPSRAGREDPKY